MQRAHLPLVSTPQTNSRLFSPLLLTLWALVWLAASLAGPAAADEKSLEVTVEYTGPGEVDDRHGLILMVLDDGNLSSPDTGIVAIRYLSENRTTVRIDELADQPVWLIAAFDEVGGYPGTGALPGPIGIYGIADGGAPSGVLPGGDTVALRFDDSIRVPGSDTAAKASLETLEAAQSGIIEIRKYEIKPGLREEFVQFFESTLEGQASFGIDVPGQFLSLDDESTFVWIRTFASQKERLEQSRAYYFSPLWLEEKQKEASRYLVSTEVLLLEPTTGSKIR